MKNLSIFPKPVDAPAPVKPYGLWLGRAAATISIVFALIHLIRIDTLVPIVDDVLPGGKVIASLTVVLVILAEILAVPFLLRMKLSPLAHIVSGFEAIFAPLTWTLLSIWAIGTGHSTGQLGEFVDTLGSPLLISLNVAWLAFAFYALWTLGYNNLKLKAALRK